MDTQRYKLLQEEYDSLKDERARIDVLVEMALEMRNTDVDEAARMADEIIEKSTRLGYPRGQGRGHNLKGSCYGLQGDYEEGMEELLLAQAIAKQIKDKKLEARVLNNFGNIYRETGDFARALNYFEEALAINELLGDEVAGSVNLTSIAQLLYDLNDFDSALDYALRCMPIFEKAHDTNRVITIYNVLGNIYFKREEYEEARSYFEKNLATTEKASAAYIIALSGMGKVYYKMQDFDKARQCLQQAMEEAIVLDNAEVQIICNYYMGRMQMDEGDFRAALSYLNKAFEMAEDYTRKHDVMSLHETLSVLYDNMGNIPSAFYHLKAYEQLKEEIFQQTTLNKLRNLQIRQKIELAQKEKEVAERTAQLKQQFMANMSHEIRTPMNAIVGMTRLLMDKSKNPQPEQLKYLKAIRQSADNLLVIINDILDLSKIEAGKIEIEHTDFVVQEMIDSVKDMLLFKAEEKGLEFRLNIDEHMPIRLVGDPTRINQVLINLAGNAVKFTEKGYVSISASVSKQEGDTYWIRFDVADTGIGISPDYVGSIFESFTQAGTDIARKFGGTGLGLTISKQLVGLMNGQISVQSAVGQGTQFTVILPLKESDNQLPVEEIPIVDDSMKLELAKMKLLLAEDNEFNRMVAEDTLKSLLPGIHIDVAVNGMEAVQKVQYGNYDIVLMDIQMPVMDGVEATLAIRNTLPAPAKDTRIIAMTANVLQEDVQKYFDTGMNAYVSKPFHPDELLLKMATVMNDDGAVYQSETAETPQAKEVKLKPLPEKVTDMQFLHQFTNGNTGKMEKYKGMFLENGPKLLAKIDEGLESGDYAAVKIAAHSMKPQLSYMGVKEEISHIFLIEQTAGEQAHYERLPALVAQLKRVCEKAFEELMPR